MLKYSSEEIAISGLLYFTEYSFHEEARKLFSVIRAFSKQSTISLACVLNLINVRKDQRIQHFKAHTLGENHPLFQYP